MKYLEVVTSQRSYLQYIQLDNFRSPWNIHFRFNIAGSCISIPRNQSRKCRCPDVENPVAVLFPPFNHLEDLLEHTCRGINTVVPLIQLASTAVTRVIAHEVDSESLFWQSGNSISLLNALCVSEGDNEPRHFPRQSLFAPNAG